MKKVAKLVTITLITRVLVDENASDETILEAARPRLKQKAAEEMFENLDSIIDDTECPYEDGEEHLSMYGGRLEVGDVVGVPEPEFDDMHQHEFTGTIASFRNGNAVVEDGEGEFFEIECNRLIIE